MFNSGRYPCDNISTLIASLLYTVTEMEQPSACALKRNRTMNILKPFGFALALVACSAVAAVRQQCPQTGTIGLKKGSEARILEGRLVFHDAIRKWFELGLDQRQCGQTSIELVHGGDRTPLEDLRGCRVRSRGAVDFSPTGYYSLATYQAVDEIEVCDEGSEAVSVI